MYIYLMYHHTSSEYRFGLHYLVQVQYYVIIPVEEVQTAMCAHDQYSTVLGVQYSHSHKPNNYNSP